MSDVTGTSRAEALRSVFDAFFRSITEKDFETLASLLTEDAVFTTAYIDARFEGREAVTAAFAGTVAELFDPFTMEPTEVYPVEHSDVAIVEYRSTGTVKRNGNPYANEYVGVFTVRDDHVAYWKEYHNTAAFDAAAGDVYAAVVEETA